MSSLLGALPPLQGRRAAAAGGAPTPPLHSSTLSTFHKPFPAPPTPASSHSPPSSILPLRLALRFSPPLLAIEFHHRTTTTHPPVTRSRHFHVNLAGKTAQELVSELQGDHPQYLHPTLISSSQLRGLMARLLSSQSQSPATPTQSGTSLLQMDLNGVDEAVLAAAKAEMGKKFNARQLRPGDMGYEYDKQVDYEEATEPSDWD